MCLKGILSAVPRIAATAFILVMDRQIPSVCLLCALLCVALIPFASGVLQSGRLFPLGVQLQPLNLPECNDTNAGVLTWNVEDDGVYFCNGTMWRELSGIPRPDAGGTEEEEPAVCTATTPFIVNTFITDNQEYPSAAPLLNGGYVITWNGYGNQDGNESGIIANTFSADNTPGTEFVVNQWTLSSQAEAETAVLSSGTIVFAWRTYFSGSNGVAVRFYDGSSLAPLTAEMNVTTSGNGVQIAALSNGNVVISYTAGGGSGDGFGNGVYAHVYDGSTYSDLTGRVQLNEITTGFQRWPKVAGLTGGGFICAWADDRNDGSGNGVRARLFDNNSAGTGSEFTLTITTSSSQDSPSVYGLSTGGFVGVWTSFGQDGDSTGIFASVFDSSGVRQGSEFQVNDYTTGLQLAPIVVSLDDGLGGDELVFSWTSRNQDGNSDGVFTRRFTTGGVATTAEAPVNTDVTLGGQTGSTMAALSTSGVVTAWMSSGTSEDGDAATIKARVDC